MLSPRSFLLASSYLVSLIPLTHALFSFNSTFPSNGITIKNQTFDGTIPLRALSSGCAEAYASPVNCSTSLMFVGPDLVNYTTTYADIPTSAYETLYKDVCTEGCYDSLSKWRKNIMGECGADFDALFSAMYSGDYKDPETYLYQSGLPVPGAGPDVEQFGFVYRDEEHVWLNYIFWGKCLRDLNTTSYCTLTELDADVAVWPSIEASRYSHLTKEEAIERNQTFCNQATCFMQSELLDVTATGVFHGSNSSQAEVISLIHDVCPSLNVNSSFPFLQLGVMYPYEDVDKKISSSSVPSTSSHGADGITDLSTQNSTDTSGSSVIPIPTSLVSYITCLMAVAGVSLLL